MGHKLAKHLPLLGIDPLMESFNRWKAKQAKATKPKKQRKTK